MSTPDFSPAPASAFLCSYFGSGVCIYLCVSMFLCAVALFYLCLFLPLNILFGIFVCVCFVCVCVCVCSFECVICTVFCDCGILHGCILLLFGVCFCVLHIGSVSNCGRGGSLHPSSRFSSTFHVWRPQYPNCRHSLSTDPSVKHLVSCLPAKNSLQAARPTSTRQLPPQLRRRLPPVASFPFQHLLPMLAPECTWCSRTS